MINLLNTGKIRMMNPFVLSLLLIFFFLPKCLFSQQISCYCYNQSDDLSVIEKKCFKARIDSGIEFDLFLSKIQKRQIKKGYITASIDSFYQKSDTLFLTVFYGKSFRFGPIYFDSITKKMITHFKVDRLFKSNRAFTTAKLHEINKKVHEVIRNNGYPFAITGFVNSTMDSTIFSSSYRIEPNGLFVFDSIIVKGDGEISTNYLRQFLGYRKGQLYSDRTVAMVEDRINKLPFLQSNKPSQILFQDSHADLYLFLKRKKSGYINGIAGLAPSSAQGGKPILTGEADVYLQNIVRRGEELAFKWQKTGNKSQNVNAKLVYPYLFNTMAGIDFRIEIMRQDTSWLTVNPIYGMRFYFSGGNYLKLFIDRKSSSLLTVRKPMAIFLETGVTEFNRDLYGIECYFANLDDVLFPRLGYLFESKIGLGQKQLFINELGIQYRNKASQVESGLHFQYYHPISSRFVLLFENISGYMHLFKPHGDSLFGEGKVFFAPNEMFRIGGLKSLRGFDENAFSATAFSMLRVELRFLYGKRSSFNIFYNQAAYQQMSSLVLLNDNPYGIGIGTDFETPAGIFAISYALGSQSGNPISMRNSRVHIGLISRF